MTTDERPPYSEEEPQKPGMIEYVIVAALAIALIIFVSQVIP